MSRSPGRTRCWLGTLICAVVGHAGSVQAQEAFDFACSAFPQDLSQAALIERYGSERVRTGFLQSLDNGPVEGTIVSFSTAGTRLEIAWRDAEARARPYSVRAFGPEWTTPHGIHIGMDLRTVEEMNGWPFRLGGLLWESLGAVRSWGSRGRLHDEETPGCRLVIHFQVEDGDADRALVMQVGSGREFSSGHPAFQALNPKVAILRMYYPLVR